MKEFYTSLLDGIYSSLSLAEHPDNKSLYSDPLSSAEEDVNKPTKIHSDGSQLWLDKLNIPHRKNGPAFVRPDGMSFWFIHGELIAGPNQDFEEIKKIKHKKDFYVAGGKSHWGGSTLLWLDADGQCHREDGPSMVGIKPYGNFEIWHRHGIIHRGDGPAKTTTHLKSRGKFWGYTKWFQNGLLHREYGPAVISADGTKKWYVHGKLHREDVPAVERSDGTREWWRNGVRHCDDGPAIETPERRVWYKNGKIHRDEAPAIESNEIRSWYDRGKCSRIGGPAVELPHGSRLWYLNGRMHRADGPAVEVATGFYLVSSYRGQYSSEKLGPKPDGEMGCDHAEWWISGKQLTEAEFKKWYRRRESKKRRNKNREI